MDPRHERYRDDREPWWETRDHGGSGSASGRDWQPEDRELGRYDLYREPYGEGQQYTSGGAGPYGPPPYGGAYGWYEGLGYRRSRHAGFEPDEGPGESPRPRPGSERHPVRRGPKGYTRSDERIQEDICDQLYQSEDIDSSEVTVQVKNATVELDGTVPERWMKHAIEDVADDCAGVRDVENNIRLQRPGEAQAPSPGATSS